MSIQSEQYTNSLLEAIKIVTENVISKKQDFDQTLVYTIKDNSNSGEGIYTVTDGFITFEATSDNKDYKKGDEVYVMIPGGKFSNEKIILAKVPKKDEETNKPVADLTLQEIVGVSQGENEINNPNIRLSFQSNPQEVYKGAKRLYEWKDRYSSDDFTRLKLSTKIKFNFGNKPITAGEYGIKLIVYSTTSDYVYAARETFETIESSESNEKLKEENKEINLEYNIQLTELDFNVKEMTGQVYSSIPQGIQQTKLFDISKISGRIIGIDVQPYAINNFKINNGGQNILFKLEENSLYSIEFEDIELIQGYGQEEFIEDCLKIYTYDSKTFKYDEGAKSRLKHLKCRLIKKDTTNSLFYSYEESYEGKLIESITGKPLPEEENNFVVFWYREKANKYSDYLGKSNYERFGCSPYVLGKHNLQTLQGILYNLKHNNNDWDNKPTQKQEMNYYIFDDEVFKEDLVSAADNAGFDSFKLDEEKMGIYYLPNTLDSAHCIKAVMLQYDNKNLGDEIWSAWENNKNATLKAKEKESDNKDNFETTIPAYIDDNLINKIYKNYLELVINYTLMNSKLSIKTYSSQEDLVLQRSQLNYYNQIADNLSFDIREKINHFSLYDGQGEIFPEYKNFVFHLEADYTGLEATSLRKNIQTTWHIPLTNTMIESPFLNKKINFSKEKDRDVKFSELDPTIFSEPYYGTYIIKGYLETSKVTKEKYLCLVFLDEIDFSLHNVLPFRIKDKYIESNENNTIHCSIQMNYLEIYSGEKTLFFDIGSTSGTNYQLVPVLSGDQEGFYFTLKSDSGDKAEILIEPRLSYQGMVKKEWSDLGTIPDPKEGWENEEKWEDKVKYAPWLDVINCQFHPYNSSKIIAFDVEQNNTDSNLADSYTYTCGEKESDLRLQIKIEKTTAHATQSRGFKISLIFVKPEDMAPEAVYNECVNILKQYYNGYFSLSIKLSSLEGIILEDKFVLPIKFGKYINDVKCNKGIIHYDIGNRLKDNDLQLIAMVDEYSDSVIKQQYKTLYDVQSGSPLIVNNSLHNCKEYIKLGEPKNLVGIKQEEFPNDLKYCQPNDYLRIVRGPQKLNNAQNIGDDAVLPHLYYNFELIMQYKGQGNGYYWFEYIKGRRKEQKYTSFGTKLEIDWTDIPYFYLLKYGVNTLKNMTYNDLNNNPAYRIYTEKHFYHYWRYNVFTEEEGKEPDFSGKETELPFYTDTSSVPDWLVSTNMYYQHGNAIIDFGNGDKVTKDNVYAVFNKLPISELMSKEYLWIDQNDKSKGKKINIYYKEEEKNLTLAEMLARRKILVGTQYRSLELKPLYDTIYYLDFNRQPFSPGKFNLYLQNSSNTYYQISDIQLITENYKPTIQTNEILAQFKRRLFTYTPNSNNQLNRDYKIPAQQVYNTLVEYAEDSKLENDFDYGYWWQNSKKCMQTQVTGAWSKEFNFTIILQWNPNKYKGIKDMSEEFELLELMANKDKTNPEDLMGDYMIKEVRIKPIQMGSVMGPYGVKGPQALLEEILGDRTSDKYYYPIDYFYDFRVVKQAFGVLPGIEIPATNVAWSEATRTIDKFKALTIQKNKDETYSVNPFPFYVLGMIPQCAYGEITIKPSKEEIKTLACWLQPFIFEVDKYTNNILNNWNGSSVNDDTSVFTTVMGAGRKNQDNTFSGIFLGEVGNTGGSIDSTYGLYGYNKGLQVFGFNDKGQAFLGGEGAKLEFNTSDTGHLTIANSGYDEFSQGIKLDFTDSFMGIKNSSELYELMGISETINSDEDMGELTLNESSTINISKSDAELVLTSNEKESDYPLSIFRNNNKAFSIDWQGDIEGRTLTMGENTIGFTGISIKNGAKDYWVTSRKLGTLKVVYTCKKADNSDEKYNINEDYQLIDYNIFRPESDKLKCYSFYRLVPKSRTKYWLNNEYLNNRDIKIYNQIIARTDVTKSELKDYILDNKKLIPSQIVDDEQEKLLEKLKFLYNNQRVHIDGNLQIRPVIHTENIKIFDGVWYNNLIYRGEYAIVNDNNEYIFNNTQYKYFAYFDTINISTALNNMNWKNVNADLINSSNYYNINRQFYWWGLSGGIYTQQSNLPCLKKEKGKSIAYFFPPAGAKGLRTDANTYYNTFHKVEYKKLTSTKTGWISSWDGNDIYIGRQDKNHRTYILPPQGSEDTKVSWYRKTQAYRSFQLVLASSADTIKEIEKNLHYKFENKLTKYEVSFDPETIYKNNGRGVPIAPYIYFTSGSNGDILYQNVLWDKVSNDSYIGNYGRYNPFITRYKNKEGNWTNIFTSRSNSAEAVVNRLQGRFSGFNKQTMENLLNYWKNYEANTDNISISIRGANEFGLDIMNVIKGNDYLFRITSTGDVYIKGKKIE